MTQREIKKLADQAQAAYQAGDYSDAASLFEQAASQYQTQSMLLDSAEMKNNQSVSLLMAGKAEQALQVVLGTADIFAQAKDFRRQGLAVGNEAAAHDALNHPQEAIRLYRQSANLLEQAGEDQMRAMVLKSLSVLQVKQGGFIDAVASMQDSVSGVKNPTFTQKLLKKFIQFRPW